MIWLDVTKSAAARHRSGLTRVTMRLADELGSAATRWSATSGRAYSALGAADTWVTAEVFAPAERPGFAEFLARRPCRLVAIYHDSIPLRLPQITWPQAVARHPAYLSMLAQFDLVWAVSAASRDELLGFWKWQGRAPVPEVRVLPLGANLAQVNALGQRVPPPKPSLLCVGILEPRKNQSFLLEVADRLWTEDLAFDLHFVGRVNPHFGPPILAKIQSLEQKRSGLTYDGPVSDERLIELYQSATACVFPTIAEGCGLPLLEALWWGTPCVASDVPALLENACGGGCLIVPTNDAEAWTHALRRVLTEPVYPAALAEAARQRHSRLPTWAQTAALIQTS